MSRTTSPPCSRPPQASHDSDEAAREVWEDVWATLAASGARATLQLYVAEVVDSIAASLEASAWGVKRQGAAALNRLLLELTAAGDFASGSGGGGASAAVAGDGTYTAPGHLPFPVLPTRPALLPGAAAAPPSAHRALLRLPPCLELRPHARRLAALLLRAIPGRVWDGKAALLSALGELCARNPEVLSGDVEAGVAEAAATDAAAASDAEAPAASPADAGPPLRAAVLCLATQAGRDSAPLPFVTAAATALSLALGAGPQDRAAYACVAATLEAVLRGRCKRPQLPALSAPVLPASIGTDAPSGTSAAGTAPPPSSGVAQRGVVGGRFDEGAQSEGRLAAKAAEAELSALAGACCVALAAALSSAASLEGPLSGGASGAADADATALIRLLTASIPLAAPHPAELAALARAFAVAWAALPPSLTSPASAAAGLAGAVYEAALALASAAAAEDRHTAARNACLAAIVALFQRSVGPGLLPAGLAEALQSALLAPEGRLARHTEPHTAQWLRVCAELLPLQ